jgi:hypothetical protein
MLTARRHLSTLPHFLSIRNEWFIALPLLLGVGVAFKIYYIMAWRDGKTGLLQSALTRAGDLQRHDQRTGIRKHVASNYPGISSMGRIMALA